MSKDNKRPPQPKENRKPPKDQPPFPNKPKTPAKPGRYEPKKIHPEDVLTERELDAARQLGTPEHLPLTPQAKSTLRALYGPREHARAA